MRSGPVAMACLLVLLLAPPGIATSANDCWTGSDAPRDHTTAPAIPVPSHCSATFSASDTADSYRFSLDEGDDLRIAIYGAFFLEVCLDLPDGDELVDCYPIDDGEVVVENVQAGTYALILESDGHIGPYELAVDTRTTTFTGKVHAGAATTGVSVSERLGPEHEALDGAWIELPFPGTGNETIELVYSSPAAHWADLILYDAAGSQLEAETCKSSSDTNHGIALGAPRTACGLPSDAAWAFVRVDTGVALDYVIELHW